MILSPDLMKLFGMGGAGAGAGAAAAGAKGAGSIFGNKELDVYFPLVRKGGYKISYIAANAEGMIDPLVVERFTYKREMDRRIDEIVNNNEAKDGEKGINNLLSIILIIILNL